MEKSEVFKLAIEYFKENEDEFNDAVEMLDDYNWFLGDDRYHDMEDLAELYGVMFSWDGYSKPGKKAEEFRENFNNLMNRIFYGYDADTSYPDTESYRHGAFCPNREYFYYNGYGNLVSTDYKDYSDRLDEYFIEQLYENRGRLHLPTEIEDQFEMVEE